MDKLKILNLFVLAFLLSLVVQSFFFPKKTDTVAPTWVILQVEDDSVTIPNIPKVEVINQGTWAITIRPCDDITLSVDSQPILGMSGTAPTFCTPLVVDAWAKKLLPMESLYRVFSSKAGKYIVTLSTPLGDRTVFFTAEEPGIIRSLLSVTVYQPIYNLFVALLTFLPGHPLGWAIIIVTIIIRLVLLVPQHHMLQGQQKLQKIQPKIKALQKEYKDDQATLGMKMLELYKKEWVNPMGSIVPLLIQMPILIGLYWVVSQINDPSNFYHLYSFFAHFDPTQIVTSFYGLELSQVGGMIGIAFALVLGWLQYVQAKLSFVYTDKKKSKEVEVVVEKKEGDAPEFALDPAMMQKMMLYFFPVMIAVSSYFFPLGVGLYWFIGTLFVIAQQAYVNRSK
jgi:YidC/Oxa1 family membrane protein insertase